MLSGLSQGALSVALWAGGVFPLHPPESLSFSGLPGTGKESEDNPPSPGSAPVAHILPGSPAPDLVPPHPVSGPACLQLTGLRLRILWSQGGDNKRAG